MSDIGPEGMPRDPFSRREEMEARRRGIVERNIRSFVDIHRNFCTHDSPDEILFDPVSVGWEGPPQIVPIDKEALIRQLDKIEAALDEPTEVEGDLIIWESIGNVSALFRGEPIIESENRGE